MYGDFGDCTRCGNHGSCLDNNVCLCSGGYTGEACDAEPTVTVVGNDLNDRAHPDGAANIEFVDTDMTFAAPGRIVSWDYFGTHRVPRAYCTVVLHVLRSPD
jgi:hypothetical protein